MWNKKGAGVSRHTLGEGGGMAWKLTNATIPIKLYPEGHSDNLDVYVRTYTKYTLRFSVIAGRREGFPASTMFFQVALSGVGS